ncbi:PAS domain-containing protein [Maridesulfovibrio sp.]|uniref:PAS domain-containing protein n=1 Tax=Maridesulfovibrio sp. TaxID=2795000 RepID=UPI0029F5C5A0|nr:PAS domain-containing protein [Maridesulfovibrio sp.]
MLDRKLPGIFKEQVTSRILFLCLIFLLTFTVNFVVDRVKLNILSGYDQEIYNQETRSKLGMALMHRLLLVELGVAKIVDSADPRMVDLLLADINHSLDKLGTILTVLQNGGTFVNTFPANFYDTDEVQEQITFRRGNNDGYAMEVIDLNPKIFELGEAVANIASNMRELLQKQDTLTLEKVHHSLRFRTMQIDALILRARESASKIFFETQVDINRLNKLKEDVTVDMDNVRLGIMVCTLPLFLFLFFRILFNISTILADRERKSNNLEQANRVIENIVDSIPVGMAIINEKREIMRVNSEALMIFDVPQGESVIGQSCENIFCFSADEYCPFINSKVGSSANEVVVRTISGRKITVLKKATEINFAGERVLLEAFMDITDRIEMEKRLKSQQDYTHAVLQGVQAGVVVIEEETHTILDMNETAAKIIGVNRDEALGAVCHEYICPAEVNKCPVTDLGQEIDHAVRKLSNGKSVLKSVVPFKRGDASYLLESFVDITDRVQTEKQLKEDLHAAEVLSRAKSEFISRMCHELRPPIKDIAGFSDRILADGQETFASNNQAHVEHISESGRKLLKMIDSVLDISTSGKIDFGDNGGKKDIFSVFDHGQVATENTDSCMDKDEVEEAHSVLFIEANSKNIDDMRQLFSECAGCSLIVRKTVEKGMRALQLLRPEVVFLGEDLGGDSFEEAISSIKSLDILPRTPFVVVLGDEEVSGADLTAPTPSCVAELRKLLMESEVQ